MLSGWRHTGPHPRSKVNRERRFALIMVVTGVARTVAWLIFAILYLCGVGFATSALATVSFVGLISVWALVETAWGQAAASWAQLTAGHAHQDAEHNREVLNESTGQEDTT